MVENKVIPGIADIILDDAGILTMKMHKTSIDIDAAQKITEIAANLAGDIVHANLVDIRQMTFMSSEARKHFGGQNKSTVKAVAIVMNAKLHRPLVNLYLKFSHPSLPTRMFDEETKARDWLAEKLKELKNDN